MAEKATGELSFGGGYSTDDGFLLDVGLRERNLVGTGINAGINGVLAQRNTSIDLSVTDPYFLDRNLVAGADVFFVQTNNHERVRMTRKSASASRPALGYDFNEHLHQIWTYSLVGRTVFNIESDASHYIQNQAGLHAAVRYRPGRHAGLSRQRHHTAHRLRGARRRRLRRPRRQREIPAH